MIQLVDVYPYRLVTDEPEFFVAKRSPDKQYRNQWRMIGGKIKNSEKAWQAGLRELQEETGFFPSLFWTVPTLNQFYDSASDSIHHIPAFAARIPDEKKPQLNKEHTEYRWISIEKVGEFILWPEQLRIIKLIRQIISRDGILKEWEIKTT